MEFKGGFVAYNHFRSHASRDGSETLEREHYFIKNNIEHFGHEECYTADKQANRLGLGAGLSWLRGGA